jgi:predicted Fe-Mo cluster-binding NifX family protein
MATVAIPVFRSRVAPTFDSCLSVLLIRTERSSKAARREISLAHLPASERVAVLQREGVVTLICGGISEALRKMLESSGVHVISGIVGEVGDVLAAYGSNRLDAPEFSMPGRMRSLERVREGPSTGGKGED